MSPTAGQPGPLGAALLPGPRPSDPGPVAPVRRQLLAAAGLTAPVVVLSAVPALQFPHWQWAALALAFGVAGWGWAIRPRGGGPVGGTSVPDLLVAVAVVAALAWSLAGLLLGLAPVYPEVAAAMTVFGVTARLAVAEIGAAGPGRAATHVAVAACAVAVATLGFWLGVGDVRTACTAAVAVLVAACPAALAMSAPPALSRAARVDTVVLPEPAVVDTDGLRVHAVHAARGLGGADALRLAGSLGHAADHPVGRAMAAAATVATGPLPGVAEFDEVPGLGWRGVVAEVVRRGRDHTVIAHAVLAGRPELLGAHDIDLPGELVAACANAAATGRTPVAVAWDGVARAVLVIGAAARPDAADAVRAIRALDLTPVLMAVHGPATARAAAAQVGIRPEEIAAETAAVERLRDQGREVAVIGEDPGTDATEPLAAVESLRHARRTATVIRGNAILALGTAVAAAPFAVAGVADPTLAAAVVVSASAVVLGTALVHRIRTGT